MSTVGVRPVTNWTLTRSRGVGERATASAPERLALNVGIVSEAFAQQLPNALRSYDTPVVSGGLSDETTRLLCPTLTDQIVQFAGSELYIGQKAWKASRDVDTSWRS
jgi:hypothetical protein